MTRCARRSPRLTGSMRSKTFATAPPLWNTTRARRTTSKPNASAARSDCALSVRPGNCCARWRRPKALPAPTQSLARARPSGRGRPLTVAAPRRPAQPIEFLAPWGRVLPGPYTIPRAREGHRAAAGPIAVDAPRRPAQPIAIPSTWGRVSPLPGPHTIPRAREAIRPRQAPHGRRPSPPSATD